MGVYCKKIDLLILFLLIPFFPISLPSQIMPDRLILLWKLFAGMWCLFQVMKQKKVSTLTLILCLFHLITVVSGIIHFNTINLFGSFADMVFVLLVYFLTTQKEVRSRFFSVFINWNGLLIVANALTMIIFPNGLFPTSVYEQNWLLGYKNVLIRRILPTVTILFVRHYSEAQPFSIYEKIILVCSVLSIILSGSTNSYIGILFFFLAFFLLKKKAKKAPRVLTLSFCVYSIANLILLSTNFLAKFDDFFREYLNKAASMKGRLAIWSRTLDLLKDSLLLGYGGSAPSMYSFSFNVSHPHNFLLHNLMLGGLVSIFLLITVLHLTDKSMIFSPGSSQKVNIVFASMYIAFFAMGFLESLVGATMLFPMLVICFNVNRTNN